MLYSLQCSLFVTALSITACYLDIGLKLTCVTGTEDWEKLVPNSVRDQIKRYQLLGYRSRPAPVISNGSAMPQRSKAEDKPQLVPK